MQVKTTKQVENNFQFCYDDEVLNATGKKFIFDIYEKNMDGIFPNKASWTKFINRIANGELADKLSYKRKNEYIKKIDYDFYYRRDDAQVYGVKIYAQIEKLEK